MLWIGLWLVGVSAARVRLEHYIPAFEFPHVLVVLVEEHGCKEAITALVADGTCADV